jgi:hypothetical protein
MQAIQTPQKVLEQISNGYVSPRALEAWKTVYPAMYSKLQEKLLQKMPENIPFKQKKEMQKLLEAKVLPSLSQNGLQLLQQGIPQQSQMKRSGKQTKFASRRESASDRLSNR